MKPQHLPLALLAALSIVMGGVMIFFDLHKMQEPLWWQVLSTLFCGALIFWWYHADSNACGYKRSKWLNIGIIALAIIAVPLYLLRSRQPSQRFTAILKLVGYCVVWLLLTMAGAMVTAIFLT